MAEDKQKISLNTDFNPQIIREIIRRHWYLPFVYIAILTTAAFSIYDILSLPTVVVPKSKLLKKIGLVMFLGKMTKLLMDNQILDKELELLKSDVLFNKVVSRLNLETSIYAEGEILTQDLYRSAPFEVIIYKLKDSSIVNKRIDLKLIGKDIHLLIEKKQ